MSSKPLRKLRLEDYVQVEWRDNAGVVISAENITISEISHSGNTLSRTLFFHPLSTNHDRLYTCSVSIDIPTTSIHSIATAQYRIIFGEISYNLQ